MEGFSFGSIYWIDFEYNILSVYLLTTNYNREIKIPPEVMQEDCSAVTSQSVDRSVGKIGAVIILLIWILAIIWGTLIILRVVERL